MLAAICARAIVIAGGRVALQGPAPDVFADPAIVELGVAPPSAVRLQRAAAAAALPGQMVARFAEAASQ